MVAFPTWHLQGSLPSCVCQPNQQGTCTAGYRVGDIRQTNETAARVFPVVLNVRSPRFYERLEKIVQNNKSLQSVDQSEAPSAFKFIRKLPHWVANGAQMASLFLMSPVRSENYQPSVR